MVNTKNDISTNKNKNRNRDNDVAIATAGKSNISKNKKRLIDKNRNLSTKENNASTDFLNISLTVQYEVYQNKKWTTAINAGVYVNIRNYYRNNIEGDLEHTYASGSSSTAKTDNKVTADMYAGLRLTRSINNKVHVFEEPFLQLNFMKYNMPGMINNTNVHRAGINIGLSYGF